MALVALACVAAAATLIVARTISPNGTADLDEVAYQSQANALAHHELTLPAVTHDPFFRPFLSGIRDDRVVFKYQPVWPALIAVSDGLSGSTLPLRVLTSMAGVLATAWFAWELLRDARIAIVAGALVAASPFSWVQGASLLGYQLSFVLGTAAAAAFLRSIRTSATGSRLAAGALFGIAVFHRPFDALLASAPVLLAWLWCAARRGSVRRDLGSVVLGGLPFAVLFLAFNQRVMGSLSRLAYNVTGPSDRFGFGWRSSFHVESRSLQIHYTIGRAFSTLGHLFVVLPRFVAFAPVVVVCAAGCAWGRRADPRARLLAAMIIVVVVGYFFWWGVANSYEYGLDRSLGPFYYYPLLAPLCVLAAWGAVSMRRSTVVMIAAVAVGLSWSAVASAVVLIDAHHAGSARTRALTVERAPVSAPSLVFEAPLFANDPYLRVVSDATLARLRLTAVDIAGRRFELLDRFPTRTPFVLRTDQPFGEIFGPPLAELVQLHVLRATAPEARVHVHLSPKQAGTIYVQFAGTPPMLVQSGRGDFVVSVPIRLATPANAETTVTVGVVIAPVGRPAPTAIIGETLDCTSQARTTTSQETEILQPCDGRHHYEFPDGTTATDAEDVAPELQVTFVAG